MSITPERKQELITEYAIKDNNTGSPNIQITVLTERIVNLTEHFKLHNKDNHSRRGLLKIINTRRSLLNYIKRKDDARYRKLLESLGLHR